MTALENLWYGNTNPHERDVKFGSDIEKVIKKIIKKSDELSNCLNKEEAKIFEDYKDLNSELADLCELEAFKSGFGLAIKIMIEVITSNEN